MYNWGTTDPLVTIYIGVVYDDTRVYIDINGKKETRAMSTGFSSFAIVGFAFVFFTIQLFLSFNKCILNINEKDGWLKTACGWVGHIICCILAPVENMWPDVWLLVQMLNWRHLVKWRQNNAYFVFVCLSGFSPTHKKCKKLFSDNILYKRYKYIISLESYVIKMTITLFSDCNDHMIEMYTVYNVLGMYFKEVILT